MKKIIKNKLYDTDTAVSCGSSSYSLPGDFDYWQEELFRKRNGEFFLRGEGGARTKYAVSAGDNNWRSGSAIIPLSLDAAREWAEQHLPAEKYQELFEVAEDDGQKTGIYLSGVSAAAAKKLRLLTQETGESYSALVDRLIAEEYDRRHKK